MQDNQKCLEKVALKYAKSKNNFLVFQDAHKNDFIAGAKWQAQKKCFCETIKDKDELVHFLIVNALKLDDESFKILMSKLNQWQGNSGDVFDSEGVWLGRYLNK
jgi:hypothetical protein